MSTAGRRPNIVLVLADDMGFSDLGCYGGEIRTPNIDSLAAGGLRYTQMYNSARCCPSRASLLTGLHPHQAGIGWMDFGSLDSSGRFRGMLEGRGAYQGFLDDRGSTIAEVLGPAGYRTLMSGKWHLGGEVHPHRQEAFDPTGPGPPITPTGRGFDEFFGIHGGATSYYLPALLMEGTTFLEVTDPGFYLTDAITDRAVGMIGRALDEDAPFFAYVAYTAPHWPLQALEEEMARYEGEYRMGWDRVRAERHERLRDAGILDRRWPISPRDPDSFSFADARYPEWEALRMAVYAAQVDRMDQGVGRMVAALRARDALENTLILVCSDNGGCSELLAEEATPEGPGPYGGTTLDGRPIRVGNAPGVEPGGADTFMSYDLPWANASNSPFRRYKSWVHEGGISTPFIVHWPSVVSPGLRTAPVHFIDVLPTLAELAGAPIPTDRDGRPLRPPEGESFARSFADADWRRQQAIWFEHEGHSALRDEAWKLVNRHHGSWELYNMDDDRTEQNDLAHSEPRRLRRMVAAWQSTATRVGVRPDLGEAWDFVAQLHIQGVETIRERFAIAAPPG